MLSITVLKDNVSELPVFIHIVTTNDYASKVRSCVRLYQPIPNLRSA